METATTSGRSNRSGGRPARSKSAIPSDGLSTPVLWRRRTQNRTTELLVKLGSTGRRVDYPGPQRLDTPYPLPTRLPELERDECMEPAMVGEATSSLQDSQDCCSQRTVHTGLRSLQWVGYGPWRNGANRTLGGFGGRSTVAACGGVGAPPWMKTETYFGASTHGRLNGSLMSRPADNPLRVVSGRFGKVVCYRPS